MRKERKNLRKNFKMLEKKQETNNKGITLIALVVTIVVLLILASVSITVIFGDNGILQLAKEAGEKTNEAVQNDKENIGNMTNYIKSLNWDTSKVTAVTTKDGGIVPVPKGFVGSEADGENTIKDGFVIYEGTEPVTDANVANEREERNQFVWVPADGVSLEYKQDKTSWSAKTYEYTDYKDWWDEEEIDFRKESVAKYGGFYVGRYEAGVEGSTEYDNETDYKTTASAETRNNTTGIPVTKKNRQAWNFVNQTNAKILSQNMYGNNKDFNGIIESRLIDSYAWDTICTWLSNNKIDVMNSTSWGNYYNASYKIKGLYAEHSYDSGWNYAEKYSKTDDSKTFLIPATKNNKRYEVATGVTVVDSEGKEIDRNKAKNIYDFAGNMWEWTTEIGSHSKEEPQPTSEPQPTGTETQAHTGTFAVIRGGSFSDNVKDVPASCRSGDCNFCDVDVSFRPVLYIK